MLKSLIILVFLILPSAAWAQSPHISIQNRDEISQSSTFLINGSRISIYARDNVDIESVREVISNSLSILPEFFGNASSCKNLNIRVYEISRSTLNNRKTMSFLNWRSWNNLDILGTYDSIYSPSGDASIFLTSDRGERVMVETLVHELAHYWQDISCIPVTEPRAYEFEKFYEARFF